MLVITYLPDDTIKLQSQEIQNMIDHLAFYTRVVISAKINCCAEVFTAEQIFANPPITKFTLVSDGIIVNPTFFGFIDGKFIDGVYLFEVKMFEVPEGQFIYQENCTFVDITYKCQVAQRIKNILTTTEEGMCDTNIQVLHYALVNGSNCGCNCNEMCEVFKELTRLLKLGDLKPIQTQGCGC